MRIHLLHLGAFADEVARSAEAALTAGEHRVTTGDAAANPTAVPAFWPRSDLHVLVAGRTSRHVERMLDRSVVESRTPAVTICLEHPRLRLGPLVDGTGACLECLHRRRAQHEHTYAKVQPLLGAYDADPRLEPFGHLPHQVALATGWLATLVEAMEHGRAQRFSGRVSYLNLLTGASGSDHVVGVHGCRRCRQTPPLAESSWRALAADLATVGGDHRG